MTLYRHLDDVEPEQPAFDAEALASATERFRKLVPLPVHPPPSIPWHRDLYIPFGPESVIALPSPREILTTVRELVRRGSRR